jgi:hypothetical protein
VGVHTGSAPVILETIGSLIVGAIGAGIGWATTEFLARPIRKFFDLRGEIIQKVAQYNNVPARWSETPDGKRVDLSPLRELWDGEKEVMPVTEDETARLYEAHNAFRDLATRMRAFAHNETGATRVLALFRYDAHRASDGLFGLSNDIGTMGVRAQRKQTISDALRIPENIL